MSINNIIRIIIADDHDIYREGLKEFINSKKGMTVTKEFNNGTSLLSYRNIEKNDILILDISMPGTCGIETLKKLIKRKVNIKIIVHSMFESSTIIKKVYEYGANSYILKSSSPDKIIEAILKCNSEKKN